MLNFGLNIIRGDFSTDGKWSFLIFEVRLSRGYKPYWDRLKRQIERCCPGEGSAGLRELQRYRKPSQLYVLQVGTLSLFPRAIFSFISLPSPPSAIVTLPCESAGYHDRQPWRAPQARHNPLGVRPNGAQGPHHDQPGGPGHRHVLGHGQHGPATGESLGRPGHRHVLGHGPLPAVAERTAHWVFRASWHRASLTSGPSLPFPGRIPLTRLSLEAHRLLFNPPPRHSRQPLTRQPLT